MSTNYNKLDPYLHEIARNLALKKADTKRNNGIVLKFLETLLFKMKEVDKLFKVLYRQLRFTGSYYEKLRIVNPDEYDINLALFLPSDHICVDSQKPGFANVHVQQFENKYLKRYPEGLEKLEMFLDDERYVLLSKVYQWMLSVIDRALDHIKHEDQYKITRKMSGPAINVQLLDSSIFIDIVPVFCLDDNTRLPKSVRQAPPYLKQKNWYLVPKGCDEPRYWRLSFYDQEKEIMSNLLAMKCILKIIKRLRDIEGWNRLASYYVKTVFLWEQEKMSSNFWKKSLGFLFIHMLGRFACYLENKNIPFYWDNQCNLLLGHMDINEMGKIANRIKKIVQKIERNLDENPAYVLTYFKMSSPCLRHMRSVQQTLRTHQIATK